MLSACVMTHNSMATLRACLDSLEFCDEIIVVDDRSSDGTWEYVSQRGGKIDAFARPLDTFAGQRIAMCARARGEWILIVDADEYVTPELATEIGEIIRGPRFSVYHVRQRNLLPAHWGRPVYFDTSQKRLFKKASVHWRNSDSPHVPAIHDGTAGRTRFAIAHHSFDSVSHLLRKQLAYALSGATELHQRGRHASFVTITTHAVGAFVKYYVLKGLWRFGTAGFVTAGAFAVHQFEKYAALWELDRGTPAHERKDVPSDAHK